MKVRFQLYWLLVVLTLLTSWGRWHESQLGLGSGKSFHKLWSHYISHSGGEGRRSSSSRFRDTHAKESKSYTLHCIKPCSLPTLNQIQPPECTRMDKRSILSNDVFPFILVADSLTWHEIFNLMGGCNWVTFWKSFVLFLIVISGDADTAEPAQLELSTKIHNAFTVHRDNLINRQAFKHGM